MESADELKKLEEELKNRESLLQTFVPITLDLQDSNYAKWRELFLVALGRYDLSAHVLSKSTPSDTSSNSDWGCDDFTVLSWIYGSISLELFGIIMKLGSMAKQIWDAIANLFRDNKKSRALALDVEFFNTAQGDMTISVYCAKLKSLSDALDDVGQPVTDETLVLTLLRGLNEQYSHLRSFLPFQVPFPSFLQTRSTVVLEEAQKKTDAKNSATTALWASGKGVLPNAGGECAPPPNDVRNFYNDRRGSPSFSIGCGGSNTSRGSGRGGRGRCDTPEGTTLGPASLLAFIFNISRHHRLNTSKHLLQPGRLAPGSPQLRGSSVLDPPCPHPSLCGLRSQPRGRTFRLQHEQPCNTLQQL
nr:uncharacterized protein LOC109765290 [Aegilops tauschii subsp. strangulata]